MSIGLDSFHFVRREVSLESFESLVSQDQQLFRDRVCKGTIVCHDYDGGVGVGCQFLDISLQPDDGRKIQEVCGLVEE